MQDYQELKERIKEHEGYVSTVYKDSLGFATIGYGHLIVDGDPYEEGQDYSKVILDEQFEEDFNIALSGAEKILGVSDMNFKAKCVIIEMVFQLGIGGVSKFKKALKAVDEEDWDTAADEMLNSKWSKQTPERAAELSSTMRSCKF